MNIHMFLSKRLNQALMMAGVSSVYKIQVHQSSKVQFGDYQVNGIIAIAKRIGIPSYQLAENIAKLINLKGIARKIDIAEPGFINIFLEPSWLESCLTLALFSPRLDIAKMTPKTIVIDYSSPNIAKEMHVGHMRSTIIGDATARVLSFLGHNVIRANHIGDWGMQFGMLIAYLEKAKINYNNNDKKSNDIEIQLSNLESFYCAAKRYYDENPNFAKRVRDCVVKLQQGDKYCRRIWQKLVNITISQNQKIYDRLNVKLTNNDIMGESLYNKMLPSVVADLKSKGLAIESEGATVVYLDEFKSKEGKPKKIIIQKKDGAYLYTTIDIACVKYRCETLKADRIIYCIDSRQHQHLMQVWTIARKAGYIHKSLSLEHHSLGMILGKDKKPFKTRDGDTTKLNELLNEAYARAYHLIIAKNPSMKKDKLEKLTRAVSVGAVKYADLSKNRSTDYVFNWDKMLCFEGNASPYLQYAYARIMSVIKRNGQDKQFITGNIRLKSKQETRLAVCLLQLEEAIIDMAKNGTPHVLCTYLYNLTVLFSLFYKSCRILDASSMELRQSRLQLALLTARTIKQGLDLLGIETVEQM
ncbi:arginine--tRNA ligase [Sodalis sp. CWE]|uniref:arginine--tRNA ligase n=1 Tax=Sodalis sp. CWE TaxID=2803816 RepID=UPI001C7DADCB|nr:arginine--tRNA ligase [Sodalis sp. CWE]MBX4181235.1 arginine--tRNA ligase [Sodalis sp. CWE]